MPASLDPYIINTVALLRAHGFNTTDSGDGESKVDMGCALPVPNVYCACKPSELIDSSERLLKVLQIEGVSVESSNIQAMFDPVDNTAGILLTCIGDRELAAAKAHHTSDSAKGKE